MPLSVIFENLQAGAKHRRHYRALSSLDRNQIKAVIDFLPGVLTALLCLLVRSQLFVRLGVITGRTLPNCPHARPEASTATPPVHHWSARR